MTIPTNDNKVQYIGAGTTDPLNVPFIFFENADISVTQVDTSGNVSTLVEGADYSLAPTFDLDNNPTGGTLTPLSTFVIAYLWTVLRTMPITQETEYVENDKFPAKVTERAFDRVVMICQQLAELVSRSLLLPVSSAASAVLPNPVGNALLGWASDGLSIENKTIPAGTAVYTTIANQRLGTAAAEAGTPDSIASMWQAGSNIVSATTLVKPTDVNIGGFHVVTGAVTIDNLWTGEKDGMEIELRFTGAPLLRHLIGNLILPNAQNMQLVAGAILRGRWEGVGTQVRVIGGMNADGSSVQPSGRINKVTTLAGAGNYSPDPLTRSIKVKMVGGGGGTGGIPATSASQAAVSPGSAGAGYVEKNYKVTDLVFPLAYSVGAAGAAGAVTPGAGGKGGDTTFGALTAGGGNGSAIGVAASTSSISATVPAGGTAAGGDINIPGDAGQAGITISAVGTLSGKGGASALSPGGAQQILSAGTSAGVVGAAPGAGSSGPMNGGTNVARVGTAGAAGTIIIEEYL